ncbi:MAG: protein translocase subunit SecD [Candidatus Lernaella stagnicola]|nr:protein translocase subunit SecD [Candidatus Lernaella stagnicola]
MKDYRILAIVAVAVLSVVFLLPTFVPSLDGVSWYPADPIHLGLDLQGGMHVVLHVDVDKAIKDELGHVGKDSVPTALEEEKLAFANAYVNKDGDKLIVEFASIEDRTKAEAYFSKNWARFDIGAYGAEGKIGLTLSLQDEEVKFIRENAMRQAREVLNNRVDEFGVSEPEIYTQGSDQIVVRLPGVDDPERAKDLIGRTAALEFKMVNAKARYASTKELLLAEAGGKVPEGYDVYSNKASRTGQDNWYLLRIPPDLSGSYLTDARVGYDEFQNSAVDFQFNEEGSRIFADLTGKNIGKQLVILLDDVVYSAPVIRSRISSRGQITGDFTRQEALDLAIVLRAGALPVPIRIEEERTVGATLGEDSIAKGKLSFIVGGIFVLIFMVVYYRKVGIAANTALVLNVLIIMAGLAMFGATLTLPGIAGIILTVGMAVDANVIINERIREELRNGKTPKGAVNTGYQRATWTILDANITTLVAAGVLYNFGTGPIRGFAVTLAIGLIASVFTAIIVTRVIVESIATNSRETLSI